MRPFVFVLVPLLVFGLACATDLVADPEPVEEPTPRKGRRPGRGGGEHGTPVSPSPTPSPSPAPAPAPAGITQISADTWQVERSLVKQWEKDPSRLGDAVQEGRGWKLRQVRHKDAWHLGMKNGDLVLDVNGYPLGSTAELMLAWSQLQGEDDLTVKFKRDGATLRHHYRIR